LPPHRIGQAAREEKIVRIFHIGNSLSDTVVGWLHGLATLPHESSGSHDAAATDWHEPALAGRSA
jgi:hypothetical protein